MFVECVIAALELSKLIKVLCIALHIFSFALRSQQDRKFLLPSLFTLGSQTFKLQILSVVPLCFHPSDSKARATGVYALRRLLSDIKYSYLTDEFSESSLSQVQFPFYNIYTNEGCFSLIYEEQIDEKRVFVSFETIQRTRFLSNSLAGLCMHMILLRSFELLSDLRVAG